MRIMAFASFATDLREGAPIPVISRRWAGGPFIPQEGQPSSFGLCPFIASFAMSGSSRRNDTMGSTWL